MRAKLRIRQLAVWLVFLACFVMFCLNMWSSTHDVNLILQTATRQQNIMVQALCWLAFGASVLLLQYLPRRALIAVILLGTGILGGIAVSGQPNTSNDSARYNWDGMVQLSGVSPYRYVPVDDHLAALRTPWLFPASSSDGNGHILCPAYSTPTTTVTMTGGTGYYLCTTINRPQVPTIYPPVAEALFTGVRAFVPNTVTYLPMQLFGFLCVLAVTLLLFKLLRHLHVSRVWAAGWAWCPLVVQQAITNAHIDIAGVVLALVATMLLLRGRRLWGGVLFGAAIMVKFLPVILLLPLLRRKPWLTLAGVVGSIALGYGIHVATGVNVFGYLSGYLQEEGYDSGDRSALVSLLVPAMWVTPVAGIIFLIALIWVWHHATDTPWLAQLILFGTALVLASPRYPWYALLLLPLIILTQRWEWFALVLAFTYRQFDARLDMFQTNLLHALLFILIVTVIRNIQMRDRWNKPMGKIVNISTQSRV